MLQLQVLVPDTRFPFPLRHGAQGEKSCLSIRRTVLLLMRHHTFSSMSGNALNNIYRSMTSVSPFSIILAFDQYTRGTQFRLGNLGTGTELRSRFPIGRNGHLTSQGVPVVLLVWMGLSA